MLSINLCIPCPTSCITCSSQGCLTCLNGYYLSNQLCLVCAANCISCTSALCMQCSNGFSLQNGVCESVGRGTSSTNINNTVIQCGPGCLVCTSSASNQIICTTAQIGYSIVAGVATKCSTSICLTCASGSMTCSSCFDGYTLIGGSCIACLDPNAVSCLPANLNYSTLCTYKYSAAVTSTSAGGYCQPCAINCLKCDINGPANCDPSQCVLGFVQLTGTLNCTACFNSCPVCDSNNPNICLNCGPRRYSDGQGSCLNCPSGCQICSSSSVCSVCQLSYTLISSICASNLIYPCAVMNSNSQCSQCFQYYDLSGSTCVLNVSCTATKTCHWCPYGYYLMDSTCTACPSLPNCLTCNANSQCALCQQGYFLNINSSCSPCNNNCTDCSWISFCNQAADGYFLQRHIDGSNSGVVSACQSPCLNCGYNANYCLTCINGYNISGSACISNAIFTVKIILGPGTSNDSIYTASDSDDIKLAKTIRSTNRISNSICASLPAILKVDDVDCLKIFRFLSFEQGANSTTITL
jgi:hypothetical protein